MMDLLSYAEWQRPQGVQVELRLIGIAFFVLVTVLIAFLYKLGGEYSLEKLTNNPYLRFAYVSFIKPHDGKKDSGQQLALESFYAAQVGRQRSRYLSLIDFRPMSTTPPESGSLTGERTCWRFSLPNFKPGSL